MSMESSAKPIRNVVVGIAACTGIAIAGHVVYEHMTGPDTVRLSKKQAAALQLATLATGRDALHKLQRAAHSQAPHTETCDTLLTAKGPTAIRAIGFTESGYARTLSVQLVQSGHNTSACIEEDYDSPAYTNAVVLRAPTSTTADWKHNPLQVLKDVVDDPHMTLVATTDMNDSGVVYTNTFSGHNIHETCEVFGQKQDVTSTEVFGNIMDDLTP